jgi:cytochrome c-type biogenesis protein CcmH
MARSHYARILASSPADAPWVPLVKEQLARLGEGASATIASLPPDERQDAVKGMVAGLAQRLAASGGTADEWARLVRSYAVLGEREKASSALQDARRALAQDQAGLDRLDTAARDLALNSTKPMP